MTVLLFATPYIVISQRTGAAKKLIWVTATDRPYELHWNLVGKNDGKNAHFWKKVLPKWAEQKLNEVVLTALKEHKERPEYEGVSPMVFFPSFNEETDDTVFVFSRCVDSLDDQLRDIRYSRPIASGNLTVAEVNRRQAALAAAQAA